MNVGKTLLAQVMEFLLWKTFHRIVARYRGDHGARTLTCAGQLRCMAFAQPAYRESPRDIEAALPAQAAGLYHMGFREPIRRSTLADANERRDWFIYAGLAQRLIVQARKLYAEEGLGLDLLIPEAGAFCVIGRGYVDFARLCALHQAGAFFAIQAKSNLNARRLYSAPSDRTIVLNGFYSGQGYPQHLRRIRFKDQSGKRLVFLANHFRLDAATVCALYRSRWQAELFKWIKPHLPIKRFFGISANTVKTQISVAVPVYVPAALIKKQLKPEALLHTLLQILPVTVFEKMALAQALTPRQPIEKSSISDNQLNLFEV